MSFGFPRWLAVATALLASSAAPAATQIIESGILKGATGVEVNGSLYDVTFVDGTCGEVFGGCNSSEDFAFQTGGAAMFAAGELRSQVIIPSSTFDWNPYLTFGCTTDEIVTNDCQLWIPYSVRPDAVDTAVLFNFRLNSGFDTVNTFPIELDRTTSSDRLTVWARFTPAAVPEPATWAMMIVGFSIVGGAMRHRNKLTLATA